MITWLTFAGTPLSTFWLCCTCALVPGVGLGSPLDAHLRPDTSSGPPSSIPEASLPDPCSPGRSVVAELSPSANENALAPARPATDREPNVSERMQVLKSQHATFVTWPKTTLLYHRVNVLDSHRMLTLDHVRV